MAEIRESIYEVYAATITFTKEDMLLPTVHHNRPLYMKGRLSAHLERVHDVQIAGFNQNVESGDCGARALSW